MIEEKYKYYPMPEILKLALKENIKGIYSLGKPISAGSIKKEYFISRILRKLGVVWFKKKGNQNVVGFPYREDLLELINRKDFEIVDIEKKGGDVWIWLTVRNFS
jgi:hypothetical protein